MSLITKQIQNKTQKQKKQLHREAIIKEIMYHQNENKQDEQIKIVTSLYNGKCNVRKYALQSPKKRKMNSFYQLSKNQDIPLGQLIRKVTASSVRIHNKLKEIVNISHKTRNTIQQSKPNKINWKQMLKNHKISQKTLRFLQSRKTVGKIPCSSYKSLPCQPAYLSKTNAKQFMNFSRGFLDNRLQDQYHTHLNLEEFNLYCEKYTTIHDAYKLVKQQKALDDHNGHNMQAQPGSLRALIFANEKIKKMARTSKISYFHQNNFVF